MPRPLIPLLVALLAPAASLDARAGTLRGTIELPAEAHVGGPRPLAYWRVENGRLPIVPAGAGTHTWAVAVLEPAKPVEPVAARVTISLRSRQFEPRLLVAPVGSTLEFRNEDRASRTVYLQDGETYMPRESIAPGKSREVRFTVAGEYKVRDVYHPHASVTVVLVATPYFASADEQGAFKIDAPDGNYTLRVYARGTWSAPQPVEVLGAGSVVVRLASAERAGSR